MPKNSGTQARGFLDHLSTEQLLSLLREESEGGDDGLTMRILEVIEARERVRPTGLLPDPDRAWADFQTYFNTPDGTDRPLYPTRDSGDGPPVRRGTRLLKRLLPLAAVIAVSLSGMIAAQAAGIDVFGALARWTDETFRFAGEAGTAREASSPENEAVRRLLQDVLDQYGVTAVPAPGWYPEGAELVGEIDVVESETALIILCDFTYGGKSFNITVRQYPASGRLSEEAFEKDTSNMEEYLSTGRTFYIMSNVSDCRAAYSDGQTALSISGELSLENLKKIIDSIGE